MKEDIKRVYKGVCVCVCVCVCACVCARVTSLPRHNTHLVNISIAEIIVVTELIDTGATFM